MKINQLYSQPIKVQKNGLPLATEDTECIYLVQYLDQLKELNLIRHYTHIPNETYTESFTAKRRNKLMGVQGGFPDYVVVTPKKVLFIEMKRSKGGVTSPSQKEWLQALQSVGMDAVVCNGYEEAKTYIDNQIKSPQ